MEPVKMKPKTAQEKLKIDAIRIDYARFHNPVSPAVWCKKEPVYEFYTRACPHKNAQEKYLVDALYWIPGKCLMWDAYGQTNSTESTNVLQTLIGASNT